MEYGVVHPTFVAYATAPYISAEFWPLQLIKKIDNQEVVKSFSSLYHFLVPSTGLLALALIGCLLYWVISSLFSRFKRQIRSLPTKRNFQKVAFVFFLFFVKEIYNNLLNTDNVLVNTDELLYSRKQILKSLESRPKRSSASGRGVVKRTFLRMWEVLLKVWDYSLNSVMN